MSLFSTIAHEGAAPARGFSLKGIGMIAAGLALGVAVGFVIGNSGAAAESSATPVATVTGLAHDDFVRLNTTDLDALVPATSAKAIESPAVVDPFIEMNTTSFGGLVAVIESQRVVDPNFLYWNTTALDNLVSVAAAAVIESQRVVDPNFLYWNTTALDNLVPVAAANGEKSGNVSEEFLYWNIASLEYPAARYSQQSSGPR